MAGDMNADMDKDQIQMMIVKLMTIETQLKEIDRERRKKREMFGSVFGGSSGEPSRTVSAVEGNLLRRGSQVHGTPNRRMSSVLKGALRVTKQPSDSDSQR